MVNWRPRSLRSKILREDRAGDLLSSNECLVTPEKNKKKKVISHYIFSNVNVHTADKECYFFNNQEIL